MNRVLIAIFSLLVVGGAVAGAVALTRETPSVQGDEGAPSSLEGKQTINLTVDDVEREFIVYMPDDLPEGEDVPVVFMFHGTGGDGNKFYNISGWKEQADEEGFIAVFPSALRYHIFDDEKVIKGGEVRTDVASYTTKWNFYGLEDLLDPDYPDQVLADDVQFTRDMVTYLEANYPVDSSRIYASGFSNGSQFVARLAVEMTDTFAAFAAVGSGANLSGATDTVAENGIVVIPRPVTLMIGQDDPKINYAAGVEEFPLDESSVAEGTFLHENVVNSYLTLLGLEDVYTSERVGPAFHLTYETPTSGVGEQEFNLVIMEGMQHVYPNGKNFPITAADIYWDFFEQYSL